MLGNLFYGRGLRLPGRGPTMDAAKQEHELWAAYEQYNRGEISSERLEQIEHMSTVSMKDVIIAMSAWRMRWLFFTIFAVYLLAGIAISIVSFVITKDILSLGIAAPLLIVLRPMIRYLFPASNKDS